MMIEPICCVLLCIPRSGTSIVGSILHDFGYFMGNCYVDYLEKDFPCGLYLDMDFENIQEEIWPSIWPSIDVNFKIPNSFYTLIQNRCRLHNLWAVESSRMANLVPEFLKACPFETKFIVCERDINESIYAWAKLENSNINIASIAVLNSKIAINDIIKSIKIPILRIDFNELCNDTATSIHRISDFLNVKYKSEITSRIKQKVKLYG